MNQETPLQEDDEPLHDPAFLALIKTRNAIAYTLTGLMLASYFAFVILLAYSPQLLARPVGKSTFGIPLGIGVILIACVLTGIYVFWANKKYDVQLAQCRARLQTASVEQASDAQ